MVISGAKRQARMFNLFYAHSLVVLPTLKFLSFNQDKIMTKNNDNYWAANIRLILKLLIIWFSVSFLFGIILVEPLNMIQLAGFKLGFWFAQQGSIICFVILIFYYVKQMDKIDRKYNVHD
jgi:putative solute:sodium symporter small subunit